MKPFKILTANALILIAIGVYGYAVSGSPTALIAPAIGVLMIVVALWARDNNSTAVHTGVVITALTAIMLFVTAIMRNNILIYVMAAATLVALILYIMDFIRRKKTREVLEEV